MVFICGRRTRRIRQHTTGRRHSPLIRLCVTKCYAVALGVAAAALQLVRSVCYYQLTQSHSHTVYFVTWIYVSNTLSWLTFNYVFKDTCDLFCTFGDTLIRGVFVLLVASSSLLCAFLKGKTELYNKSRPDKMYFLIS